MHKKFENCVERHLDWVNKNKRKQTDKKLENSIDKPERE